ncbi:cupredoxin domain-containing protein [Polycladomyces subterraneus]|uniref:Cupredoxin domain-containing protein n=1 Tax=Polycladomyces subterraneus TaxID=1016997 RepID=A0ABT8IPL4_9BACL|nr:cupredoxin domain-containing protein [Polycladomyces subterraneus]MDN4594481.1 cupredoxin domain-containing protein [Polycladomyces subterraneus]
MSPRRFWLYLVLVLFLTGAVYIGEAPFVARDASAGQPTTTSEKTFYMVTGEVKGRYQGKKLEAYRWDPGMIVVHQGDRVHLVIRGVSGKEHPFSIQGYHVRGNVRQGQITRVSFTANKPGTFQLICHTHPTAETNGPMIGYIVVLPRGTK